MCAGIGIFSMAADFQLADVEWQVFAGSETLLFPSPQPSPPDGRLHITSLHILHRPSRRTEETHFPSYTSHSPASSALALRTLFHVLFHLPSSCKSPKTRRNASHFQAQGELSYTRHRKGSACRLTRSTTRSNTIFSIRSDIWVNMADEGTCTSA